MASPPANKKRALEEVLDQSYAAAKARRRTFTAFISQQQLESLQAELDHERSLRELDQKRAQQSQERLEKQVALAVEEAAEAKKSLADHRGQSKKRENQLRQQRDEAIEQLRDYQLDMEDRDERDDASGLERLWEEKCHGLETKLEVRIANEERLRQELADLKTEVEEQLSSMAEEQERRFEEPPTSEDAPSALLKELNRVRVEKGDAERQQRQLKHQLDESERRNKLLIQEREEARLEAKRLPVVQQELDSLQRDYETLSAENTSWTSFARSLKQQLKGQDIELRSANGPPEVATILRYSEKVQNSASEMARQKKEYQDRYVQMKESIERTEARDRDFQSKERSWIETQSKLESQLEATQRQVETLKAQEAIYKRETDSLRSLIKTFDDLPLSPKGAPGAVSKLDTSAKTLEVTLSSTREELQLVMKERDRLSAELEVAVQAHDADVKEIARIREKFGKLREAWQAERAKVERAEERVRAAEALAGKGSFDPDHTRVLHLKETPLTEALKQEVEVLKRQLEAVKGEKGSAHASAAVDPEKLNQRLKENFKEQISLFREGVYLMTGYKVDMLPGCDRPTFRVRSVYAENEDDQLLLKWPKTEEVKSLDILKTDFAQLMATTPSYDYMTKFQSLPAFLASVQLNLFEKQTILM